ncbi:ABC transporter substrate-binding protein [Acetobacter farinalis]|uniref:ABC transporter substrate-binding protein n=2 Tax=Acetobacter farinalis TaxID=1260984 RepID=A0ABT3Q8C8_9PROT|nr:ABC transporter substrate-binding protein [Acetobacter farinalis]MCX2561531.1 ABC transporter substrate-binding protein [Acetobacter farinalis]
MSMKSISLRAGLVLGLGMTLLPAAGITPLAPAALAQGAPASAVSAPVQALYAALDKVQHAHSSFAERSQIVGAAVDQAYDLDAVLHASIGLRYQSLTPDDKTKLLAAFRNFTVARYVSSFKPGSDARFTVKPGLENSPVGGNKIVNTYIGAEDSMPGTPLSYIMHNDASGWKIVDVLLGESRISQAAAQRSDFSSTLASGGVSGLITVLDRKVKTFSND